MQSFMSLQDLHSLLQLLDASSGSREWVQNCPGFGRQSNLCSWDGLNTRFPPKLLHHSPPQQDRGEKTQQKAHGSR